MTDKSPAGAPEAGPVAAGVPPGKGTPGRIDSAALFGGEAVVLIDHEGETYTLRRTRLGRLILTK